MSQSIAVVGIGCYYPGAKNLKELWENILARRRQFREMPNQRLPLSDYYDEDPNAPDRTYSRYAAVIDGFEFDWAQKRIPKSTYETTDIVHWLALEVAAQALEDAGYTRENMPKNKTGVIVGNTLTGEFTRSYQLRLRWPFVRKALRKAARAEGLSDEQLARLEKYMESIYKSVFPPVTEDTLAGALSNTIAGRICNFFDFHGGGYTVDGACSSSLIAVATAAGKLANKELDIALAGGVDISLDPLELVGFAKTGALTSKDMNVYDRNSSGFIPGEGCGFVVLKRLEDAKRDGDYVYAVIRGWGISSDGKGGITAPKTQGQALALTRAYELAGYSPHELDFIEGHGTGTVVGDRTELEAIALARDSFGKAEPRSCGVTSFKSLVGHTKAAAGIGGFIKAVLSVNQRVLVPTAACREPNEVFYKSAQNIYPILQGEVLPPDRKIRAGVSAMGFGGINCHVTLESADAPKKEIKPELDERALLVSNQETELFVFAADTREELLRQVNEAIKQAEGMAIAEMVDFACHLAKNLKGGKVRAAVIADHPDRLLAQLRFLAEKLQNDFPRAGEVYISPEKQIWISNQVNKHRVGFLFPGQGSQKLNMARTLVERFAWAREVAELVWKVLPNGKEVVFRPTDRAIDQEEIKDWEKQLSQTEIAQPTICLASVLWTKFLERLGIKPDVTAGHSLGELSALYAAGAYDEETLFKLAVLRGEAMSATGAEAGTMASLRCNREEAEKILAEVSGYVTIANLNSLRQTVISGEKEAVAQAVKIAQSRQIQAVMLPVSNAFHSELVQSASDTLRKHAPLKRKRITLAVPFISGIDGKEMHVLSDGKTYLAQQVMSQVDFISLLKTVKEHCDLLVEVGPGRVLTGLVEDLFQNELPCFPVESKAGADHDLNRFLAAYFVHGGQVQWDALYENRLVRPFVPASEKKFIVNPCERPLVVPEAIQQNNAFDRAVDLAVPEAADLAADLLQQYLAQRGSFLLDVIRADLKHLGKVPSADLSQLKPVSEPKPSFVVQHTVKPKEIESSLKVDQVARELAAERTGFPVESIQLSHRLLDDLNLDSIKSAELVSAIAQRFAVADQIDPAEFANATLADVVQQIEALLPDPQTKNASVSGQGDVNRRLIEEVERITGFPRDSITMDLRLLDDLNLDSIKSAELVANVAKELGVADRIDPSLFANATLEQVSEALESLVPGQTKATSKTEMSIWDALLDKVVELTGFPRESIDKDLRLLDDLNLDSIKSAELVSQVAKEFGLQDKVDPTLFANATLGEIDQKLSQFIGSKPASAEVTAQPQTKLKQSQSHAWVRNFAVDYVEQPRTTEELIHFPEGSRFLIVADEASDSLAQALAEKLDSLSVSNEIATFAELENQNRLKEEAISHFVVILPKEDDKEDISEIVKRLQSVVQPVKQYGYQASITYVQFGGGYFGTRSEKIQLGTCTAHSFAASLHMERPNAKIRVIDFSPELEINAMVQDILAEISAVDPFISVGYDQNNVRRVPQARVLQPARDPRRPIDWTNEDVILVTGGAKGITAECALAVAKSTGAKMALVGSSSVEHPDIQRTLERYRQEGLIGRYYQCDITNRNEVELLIQTIENELGPVTGVIHGAALMQPRRAEQISHEAFMKEIGPKIFGALHLCEVLKDKPPKLLIGFTSLAGITGMAGNTSYGFSNEALHLILRRFENEHPETQILAVAFSVWDEVGMGARAGSIQFLEKKGTYAIPVAEGVRRLVHLFHHDPQTKQVVVTAKLGGIDTWNPRPVKREKALRFIEEIVYDQPEVEFVARTRLTLDKDSYVKDHVYNGTYLFPAVFGLEAMAQAVAYATGNDDFSRVRIEDIQLKLPIVVDPQKGVEIEIRAEVLEDQRVIAEIRTEQTGFAKPHFMATFVFPTEQEEKKYNGTFPSEALPIEPKEDLYGPMLFHGPLYQRLEKIYGATHDPEHNTGESLFTAYREGMEEYLLGDPYFHDGLLQSGRVITPQDECLPVEISSFEIYGWKPSEDRAFRGVTRLIERNGSFYTYTVDVLDDQNRIMLSLTGYKVHIMEHDPALPTAEELASGAFRDERKLTEALEASARILQLEAPVVTLAHISDIHKQAQEERRKQLLHLFRKALNKAGVSGDYTVKWDESGKPRVMEQGTISIDYDVSFSHDDEVTICTFGHGQQGCDILPIETNRSEEDWQLLLTSKHHSLFQQLKEQGDSAAEAGSRIWTCVEAVKKAIGTDVDLLTIKERREQVVFLETVAQEKSLVVLTLPVSLSKPVTRMVAIVLASQNNKPSAGKSREELYGEFHPEHGFVYRLPLTFKDTPTLSRKVNVSSFSTWMGKIRELSLSTILPRITEQFASGKWGMVTNFAKTEVFGEAESHDVIEVHLQIDQIKNDNYLEIVYYWYKVKEDGQLERIAISRQGLTWVEIVGHGLVKPSPFPAYFKEFLQEKLAVMKNREQASPKTVLSKELLGKELYEVKTGPHNRLILQKQTFETTLEESNLVGNIYFSNYAVWQGNVRDRYFYQLAPEYYHGTGEKGEWIVLSSEIQHLREAMPFDTIEVQMALLKRYEYGIKLYFEFFKLNPDGQKQKLAYGEQDLLWVQRDSNGTPIPANLPEAFEQALMVTV